MNLMQRTLTVTQDSPHRGAARARGVASLAMLALSLAAGREAVAQPAAAPSPDPRVGLKAGWMNAAEAEWNLKLVSTTPPPAQFINQNQPGDFGFINSDLAFTGKYVVQGNFNGIQAWDISQPAHPALVTSLVCPGAQNDVSVYRNLLFVSVESNAGRVDCGTQGVKDSVSADRMRGVRIFDIADIAHPRLVTNVQTCRGSHTHTVVTSPADTADVFIYVSGSAPVRSPSELAGCSALRPDQNPNGEQFKIEVIQVPLAHPEQARVVNKPEILGGLAHAASHGETPQDRAGAERLADSARAHGGYVVNVMGTTQVLPPQFVGRMLDSMVHLRGGTGAPTGADSAMLRDSLQPMVDRLVMGPLLPGGVRPGPVQCHDITAYPAIGLAGGACAGYGLILDIRDPANPRRVAAVSDSNFSYWHSATFSNDGSKVLFTDEWGGGLQPRCRDDRPQELGRGRDLLAPRHHPHVRQLLQDAGAADGRGELRRPQRLAGAGARPRHHGAGLVSGRHLGLRLDRPGASQGDRLLRPRADGLDQAGGRGLLVGVLVQRPHRQLGDRARARRPRPAAEHAPLAERDRRREADPLRPAERAGSAPVGVAGELRGGPRLPRPARADERTGGRAGSRRRGGPWRPPSTRPDAGAGATSRSWRPP